MADASQTIIIKKIKKGGHGGHHGGAWKVAYADFVTAMMAFFLLMWLLNATEAVTLSGLADYFAPTIGVKDNMGIGFRGGKAALSKGMGADKNTNKGIIYGGTPAGPIVKVPEKLEEETGEPDDEKIQVLMGKSGTTDFQGTEKEAQPTEAKQPAQPQSLSEIAQSLQNYINEMSKQQGTTDQSVAIVETPEGIEIQIKDMEDRAMFKPGTAELEQTVQDALAQLAGVLSRLPNYIAITGHTSSVPVHGKAGYSNWELSADRANSVRRFLIQSGVQPEQFARVVGEADNQPLDQKHPAAAVNNRIGIVLLRDALLPEHKLGAPTEVFIDPHSADAKELEKDDEDEEDMPMKPQEEEKKKEFQQENKEIREEIQTIRNDKDAAAVSAATVEEKAPAKDATGLTRGQAAEKALTVKEEKPKAETKSKRVNQQLLEESKEEKKAARTFEKEQVQDPIAGGAAINPLNTVKEEAPKKEKPKPAKNYLLEENKDEEKAAKIFQKEAVQDPFAGKVNIDPLQQVKEDAPKKKEAPKTVNQQLIEDDTAEDKAAAQKFEQAPAQDPFSSGEAIDPFKAADEAAASEKKAQKKPKAVPAKAYLLEKDKDEGTPAEQQYDSLPVQDPFSSGKSINPLDVPPEQ